MTGVRLLIQFTADSAEIADKAIGEMAERSKKAQQEPGCLQFEVFRSALRRYVQAQWLAFRAGGVDVEPEAQAQAVLDLQ